MRGRGSPAVMGRRGSVTEVLVLLLVGVLLLGRVRGRDERRLLRGLGGLLRGRRSSGGLNG
jgi:hypothetical protein